MYLDVKPLLRHITNTSELFLFRIFEVPDGFSQSVSHHPPHVDVIVIVQLFAETVVLPLHFI